MRSCPLERQMPGGLVARVEGYYKRFDHLLLGRLETPDETRARIATYDFPSASGVERAERAADHQLPDESRHRPRLRRRFLRRASGEVVVRSSDRVGVLHVGEGGDERVRADVSRGLRSSALAQRRRDISLEPARRSRHDACACSPAFPTRQRLACGSRRSKDADDLDGDGNVDELIPQRDSQGLLVWATDYGDISNLKSARLPLYARVDFRATFKPGWMNRRWQIYVEVMNVLNRKNASSLDPELDYDPEQRPPAHHDRPRRLAAASAFARRAFPLLTSDYRNASASAT